MDKLRRISSYLPTWRSLNDCALNAIGSTYFFSRFKYGPYHMMRRVLVTILRCSEILSYIRLFIYSRHLMNTYLTYQ